MSMFCRPSGSSRRRSARRAAVRAAVSALFKRMARRPAAPASLLAAAALALPLHGLAQDSGERVVLAATPIVITATRTPTRVDETLAEVSVIDRAALDRAGGRTLAELLAQQPGVQFWSDGGLGKRSSVSLRGLESRHTLLLVDGVRVGSASVGAPAWESLPLAAIERIEIVRGPLSGLYGSDAVGGVVQVFTRRGGQGLQGGGSVAAGSEGLRQAAGHLRAGEGAFEFAAGVQHTELDGVSATNASVPFGAFDPDRDGWRQTGGHLSLGWRFADGWRADLQALHADGVTQLDDGPGADARAGLRTGSLSLRVGGAIGPGWRSTLQLARSTDDYETIASASPWTEIGTIATVQRQIGWENTLATPAGALLLLAERVTQSVSRPGAPFEVDERSITGLAAGLNGSAGAHHWQASLRRDRNSQFGRQTTGSLAWGLDLSPAWRVGAAVGTSFVAPSFNLLYFPGFSNPDLQPEEGEHGELSLQWTGDETRARLAWFDNRIRGYITSGPAPVNVPRTRISGWTASAETRLDGWSLSASLDLIDPRNDTAGSPVFGRRLVRRAAESLRLAADRRIGALSVGATLAAFGERYDDAANTVRLSGFGTLDLRAEWALARDWSVGLTLNNAGDRRYETVQGYNQPGRQWLLTLRGGAR
jgi:vitamin B12 transporter